MKATRVPNVVTESETEEEWTERETDDEVWKDYDTPITKPTGKKQKKHNILWGKKNFFSPYIDIEMQALNSLVTKTWIEQTLQLSDSTFFALMNFSVPFVNKATYVIYNGYTILLVLRG